VIFGLLLLSGCVAVERPAPGVKVERPATAPTAKPSGVYHKVQKGETIWRIAQAYGVSIDEIIRANNIPNGAVIEKNQLLLIPGKLTVVAMAKPEEANVNDNAFMWPVKGKVVSLTDYGAFVEIEKGIEGLIHNSEMSWTQHIKHPSQVVAMGQVVEAVILSLDKEEKKISLGSESLSFGFCISSSHSQVKISKQPKVDPGCPDPV